MPHPVTPLGKRFAFVHSNSERSIAAYKNLAKQYGQSDPTTADIIVALGGDGFMLQTLNQYGFRGTPIYGMNRGTVGFLLNEYRVKNLPFSLDSAVTIKLRRLKMQATTLDGKTQIAKAINDVSLFRQTAQSARLSIHVDGAQRLGLLVCDGILIATPAGSTAYNLSAHGPIIPLRANLHALTPISAYRPRRWGGALLSNLSKVTITVLDAEKRPVAAAADSLEVRNVLKVEIETDRRTPLKLLFEHDRVLEDRILSEQFVAHEALVLD